MKFKVNVSETQYGYYIIEAKDHEDAESKYYDGDHDAEFISNDGNFEVASVEDVMG